MAVSMRRSWIVLSLAAVLIVAGGAAGIFFVRRNAAVPPQAAKQTAPSAAATDLSVQGRIQAQETLKVGVPIDGRIAAFHVEVGDEVYEGQLLAEIKNDGFETAEQAAALDLEREQQRVNNIESTISAARLEASRAAADAARVRGEFDRISRAYERQKLLFSEGATPRLTYEKAEKDYRAIEAEAKNLAAVSEHADQRVSTLQRDLDTARRLLETKTTDLEAAKAKVAAGQIVSPATGVVAGRRGQAGDEANPMTDDLLLIATDLSHLEVLLEVDPKQQSQVKPGMAAAVLLADVPNESLQGAVKSSEGGKVIVEFANPSPVVKPGMTAQVRIRLR